MKEEKEKKQRAQEFEMRKLKNDIQDLMNTFDESLLQFFDNRLQVWLSVSTGVFLSALLSSMLRSFFI